MINTTKPSRLLAPLAAAILTTALSATPAAATWSILITDTRTGEFVVGSATCLTGFDLAIETPVVLTGIGAITAQSSVDSQGLNRMFVRDRLLEGQPLALILDELSTLDPGHNNRQYGMVTTTGDTLTYSGTQNADWAGGITGRIEQGRPGPQDDIVYAVQGNILTGQPVVQAAVDALIAEDSDLPGKLMAAMIAARVTGGDGRCSCSPSTPTACGSPPPGDFKSAHVGYMIGSRADDTDSIRAFYQLPAPTTALTNLGQNQYAISDTAGNIHIYNNATNTTDQVAHFNLQQTIETNLPNLTKLNAADLDNNGLDDLVALSGDRDFVLLLQSKPGTFEPPHIVPFVRDIETFLPYPLGNYPGDQLFVLSSTRFSTLHFIGKTLETISDHNDGKDLFDDANFTDLDNDGILDLVLSSSETSNALQLRAGDGSGSFSRFAFLATSSDPVKIRTADINNDNLPDILVATGSSRVIDTFINTGTPENPTFAPKISSPISAPAVDFQFTDLNNDTIPDIAVVMTSGANFRYYLGDAAGNFTETNRTRLGGNPTNLLKADLNNDGDQDLITNATSKLLIYDNLQNAIVQRQTGFARGDKFMFINIANQNAAADDPVDQMVTQFAAFRASLAAKVDAVQTTATIPSRVLIDDPATPQSIRIELRDYQSNLITDPATFTLHFHQNNLTPSTPIKVAPGIYDIPISASSTNEAFPGDHPLKVQATVNKHTVTLMPTLTVSTTNSLADFNADSYHDFFDISLFLRAFSAHNPIADLNNDTLFDIADITLFLAALKSAP